MPTPGVSKKPQYTSIKITHDSCQMPYVLQTAFCAKDHYFSIFNITWQQLRILQNQSQISLV